MGGVAVIPGHITALYVFAVLNLMALFHISLVEADIMVLDSTNTTLETMPDMPAQFGPGFPAEGLWGHIIYVDPHDGCGPVNKAPEGGNWIAIMARNNCNFDTKVYFAQKANYSAAIVHNIQSDDLVPMGRSGDQRQIYIPSCFIGSTDADYLIKHFSGSTDYSVVIDNRSPFNFNINYLVPFAIVVGICFVLMVVFMVARWVLDYRKRRKSRLSKDALKKIPIKKFKKGDHYDVCAICLDEYEEGEKLRILPCSHAYHMKCIDPWLTKSKRNCPVCKRKVIPGDNSDSDSDSEDESEGAGENTPLLTASNSNMNTHHTDNYARSGLPASMRGAANSVSSGSDSDTDSDGALGSSYQSQSLAQVHASPRSGRIGYGATAEATPATEVISASPTGSAHMREGYESLDGAVGGESLSTAVEVDEDLDSNAEGPGDFVDDHFCGDDNEMSGLISGGEAEEAKKESFLVKILGRKSPRRGQDGDEA